MSLLLIHASPSSRSRSSAVLNAVRAEIGQQITKVNDLHIAQLPPQALVLGDSSDFEIHNALAAVQSAQTIVIATPVYKAAYSGLLKVFLDLLPQAGLQGKTILPLAIGGSANHMLVLDYALRPVLQSLAARHILQGVYGVDSQISLTPTGTYSLHADLQLRLHEAVMNLLQVHEQMPQKKPINSFKPIPFSHVRCCI